MIRPVFEWPKLEKTALPSAESSSKLKRSALNFLSTIRVGDEDVLKKQEPATVLLPIEESIKEKANLPHLPAHGDSGWGARMRGDVRTQYTLASGIRTDKPHRLFLSWDRAYPAIVTSLVLPLQQPNAGKGKNASKSSTLELPRDDTRRDDSIEGDENPAKDDRYDSSSDDEGKTEWGARGRTFGFLLKSQRHLVMTSPKSPRNGIIPLVDEELLGVNQSPVASARKRKIVGISNEDEPDREKEASSNVAWDTEYAFEMLDDSRMIQGKHRVVQNLPSVRVSIIPYIKTKVLKDELNSVFREQHPELPSELTLSMLRRLKKEMLERARFVDLELCTVALAYVYFEKLVLKKVVHKANRKVVAFTCLVIAFKFNESGNDKLKLLLQDIEKQNGITSAEIFKVEFAVFAHLRFNLMLSGKDYFEHFVRLMRAVDIAPSEYLGETHDEVTHMLKNLATQGRVKDGEDTGSDDDDKSSKSSSTTKRDELEDIKSTEA